MKRVREDFSMSKERAAQLLNIQIKHIESLEKGDWGKLPAEVYTKGILRRYARELRLDEEQVIAEYASELKIARHLQHGSHKALPLLRSRKFVLTPKAITLILGGLLFLFIAGYLIYQVSFLVSSPKLELSQPANDLVTDQRELEFIGQTEPEATLTINGQSVYLNKNGQFNHRLELNQGLNTIKLEAINRFGKKSDIVRQIMVN